MSVLPDTSVWIEHFRDPLKSMDSLIVRREVILHSAIIGELSVGNLTDRATLLGALRLLPSLDEPESGEVLRFIETHKLYGQGLSWVDAQLLASLALTEHRIWTFDKRLRLAAESLDRLWSP